MRCSYDGVDGGKLWQCVESVVFGGRVIAHQQDYTIQSYYTSVCVVCWDFRR